MPFESDRQRRFMYAKHPKIAARWTREAKGKKEPVTKSDSTSLVEIAKMARGLLKGVSMIKPPGGVPPVRIKAYGGIGEQNVKLPPGLKTRH